MAFPLTPRCIGSSSILLQTGRRALGRTASRSVLVLAAMQPRPDASCSRTARPFSSPSLFLQRSHTPLPSKPRSSLSASLSRRPSGVSARTKSSTATATTTSSSSSSSTASRFSPAASSTTPATNIPKGSPSSLTWNEYLALRTRRRRINVLFSAVCGLSTMGVGAGVLAAQDLEQLNAFSFGLDPMIVLGAATMACGMVGWLLGPFLGGAVFNVMYRRVGNAMREKERDLFRRIKRYRSDPTGQSVSNPVPDYYGEKISSVQGYRRWLKDQRAFRKKREVDVV